jgi:hypothetical protein
MGDYFETIADVDASPHEATKLASSVIEWLVGIGVVEQQRSDCTPRGEAAYPPGPNYTLALSRPGAEFHPWQTNGLEVVTDNYTIFNSLAAEAITCPHCDAVTSLMDDFYNPNRSWDELARAIEQWCAGGDGSTPCVTCGQQTGLNDWLWAPCWAFGHLGFTFWNWPELRPGFVKELSRRLGHRTVSIFSTF